MAIKVYLNILQNEKGPSEAERPFLYLIDGETLFGAEAMNLFTAKQKSEQSSRDDMKDVRLLAFASQETQDEFNGSIEHTADVDIEKHLGDD